MSHRHLAALGAAVLSLVVARPAAADSIIKHPGDHPKYSFEAEPHLAFDIPHVDGVGPGFRGTFVLLDNGFVSSINNSIGLGLGLDWIFYGHDATDAMIPVVMQWNFWLHPQWSVFGEPGVTLHLHTGDHHPDFDFFTFYAGGRFHFNDSVALTLRLGTPIFHDNVLSVGVSFLL